MADVWCVYGDVMNARRGIAYVPPSILPVAVLVWSVWCVAIAMPLLAKVTRPWSVALAIFAGPGLLSFLYAMPLKVKYWPNAGYRRYIIFLVCAFIPVAVSAVVALRRLPVARALQRAFAWTIGVVVLCAVATIASRVELTVGRSDHRATDRRSVVLIFLDAVRADSWTPRRMPNLYRLGERGTRFTRAFAPSSWTLPSHLSVATGVSANELGVDAVQQSIGNQFSTLAERFQRAGYRTGAVLSNWFPNPGSGMRRGYDTFQYPIARLDFERTGIIVFLERWYRYFDMWIWWDAITTSF